MAVTSRLLTLLSRLQARRDWPGLKVVASATLDAVDWNTELISGDVVDAVRRLKERPGWGIALGGVRLPAALAAAGSSSNSRSWCIRLWRGVGLRYLKGPGRR